MNRLDKLKERLKADALANNLSSADAIEFVFAAFDAYIAIHLTLALAAEAQAPYLTTS